MTLFFSGLVVSRCSKACLYKVSRKKSKNWLRRTNFKPNLTPKIEYIRKPGNYNAKPWFSHLTAQNSKCPRRFRELDTLTLHTCLTFSCRTFYHWGFCFFFFFAENVGSLKTQTSPKIQKPKYLAEKTKKQKKTYSLKARQENNKHVCRITGFNSEKQRGHWRLNEFGVLCLNQPVVPLSGQCL